MSPAESSGASPDREASATWPYVLAFAHEMERKLAANRHKGDREGWVKMPQGWLLTRVLAETAELASALDAEDGSARITSEAADLANFAMMIADVAGGLSLLGATPREDARAEAAHVAAQIVTPAIRLKLGAQTEYLESAIRAALVECDNLLREVNDDREDLMGGGLTVDPLTARVNALLGATEPAKEPRPMNAAEQQHERDVAATLAAPGPFPMTTTYTTGVAAPPVMDEAANAGQMTDAQVMAEAQKGYNWLAASHAEAAREAPEPETPSLDKISADDAKIHELKCWPTPFSAVLRRMKRHEFRPDDRDFKPGDFVTLREWNPDSKQYTGGKLYFRIGTVSRGPFYGIPGGYCVFTLLDHARAAAHGDADAALRTELNHLWTHVNGIVTALGPQGHLIEAQRLRSLREPPAKAARLGGRP